MRHLLVGLLTVAALALSQIAARPEHVTFENRPALLLANDRMAASILLTGGALANLALRGDPQQISPFWNPVREARQRGEPDTAGTSLGQWVCVDGFGAPSLEEQAARMPFHGEAHQLPWNLMFAQKQGQVTSASFYVQLPLVQETFKRTFRIVDGENIIYVESVLESRVAFDRPIEWAEHVTIGPPFLEPGKTAVDMPAIKARTRDYPPQATGKRLASARDFTWPMAPAAGGGTIDIRTPPAKPAGTTDHSACLMDPSKKYAFVTALDPDKRLLLGYVFKPDQYPWVQNWEYYPADGKLARGMEFSTVPFDVPRRTAVDDRLFGAPTYRWLPAKSKIESQFLLFYTQTPEGFRKVDGITFADGKLVIEDRTSGKKIELPAALEL